MITTPPATVVIKAQTTERAPNGNCHAHKSRDRHSPRKPLDHVLPDRRIRAHYRELGGAPGAETSGLEPAGTGHRIRYQNGAIYVSPDSEPAWVHGAIADRYDSFGGSTSWLGLRVLLAVFPLARPLPSPTSRHR